VSGTVACPACGHDSACVYRCAECGRDLTGATTYTVSHGDIIVNDGGNNRSASFYAGYVQSDDGPRSPWNDLAPSTVDLEFADAAVRDAAERVLGLYSGTTECGKELPAVADANELAYRILQELYGDAAERPERDSAAEEAVLEHVVQGNLVGPRVDRLARWHPGPRRR
jgi:DNA-directed RNA polymerase subunit RPC12/RpoP